MDYLRAARAVVRIDDRATAAAAAGTAHCALGSAHVVAPCGRHERGQRTRLVAAPAHVLLVNHASYLDAIVLTALLPPAPGYTFTAKREFAGQRLMRALLTGLGAIFIERFDVKRSMEDVDLMVAALIHGDHLLVFPEGTFSRKPRAETFSCRRFRGIGLGQRTSRGGGFARQAHCVAERNRVAAPRRDRIQS